MRNELEMKVEYFTEKFKEVEQAYKDCVSFYCEDPSKGQSDEICKKIFKCIHFISNSERTYKVVEEKLEKEK